MLTSTLILLYVCAETDFLEPTVDKVSCSHYKTIEFFISLVELDEFNQIKLADLTRD